MEEGILVIGIGEQYAQMALNLALSVKLTTAYPISLLTVEGAIPPSVEERGRFFDSIIKVPKELRYIKGLTPFQQSMALKLHADQFTPYNKTLLLDADTIFFPGQSFSACLIDTLLQKGDAHLDFAAYNNGYYDIDTGMQDNKYTYWCNDPAEAAFHYGALSGIMPQINASLICFKKLSPKAQAIFATAREVWFDTSFDGYIPFKGSKTEEFCFNIACAKEGVMPCFKRGESWANKPIFIQMHTESFPGELYIMGSFPSGMSLAGALVNSTDDRLKVFYNKVSDYFRSSFGIVEQYHVGQESKNQEATQRRIVGFWHVALMGNWQDVVLEQAQLIAKEIVLCGRLREIVLCAIGPREEYDKLKDLVLPILDVKINYLTSNLKLYEFGTLKALQDYVKSSAGPFFGFYIHTKGVSSPDSLPKKHWRDYLNHYTICHYHKAVAALENGCDLAGVNWLTAKNTYKDHFSGNFFWFDSEYIKRLPPVSSLDIKNRYAAEMWHGSASPKVHVLADINVSDHSSAWFPSRKLFVIANVTMDGYNMLKESLEYFDMNKAIQQLIISLNDEEDALLAQLVDKSDTLIPRIDEEGLTVVNTLTAAHPGAYFLYISISKSKIETDFIPELISKWPRCIDMLDKGFMAVVERGVKGIWFVADKMKLDPKTGLWPRGDKLTSNEVFKIQSACK